MAVSIPGLTHLTNPLASATQLETSASQLDGVPKDIEDSIRFESARLLQAAGILLRLPQELVAKSIVLLYRIWLGCDGASMLEHDSTVRKSRSCTCVRCLGCWHVCYRGLIQEQDIVAALLYVTAKPSAHSVTTTQTLIVFNYLQQSRPDYVTVAKAGYQLDDARWHLSDADLQSAKIKLYDLELLILHKLGFQTHVALPYNLCINYMQTLDVSNSAAGSTLAKRTFAQLNTALLSPQLLYLTHQPSSIATAAIYLAARETDVKLAETEWWEVFDVDREDLGFLVVALQSVEGFALGEKRRWAHTKVPLTVDALQAELGRRNQSENGD